MEIQEGGQVSSEAALTREGLVSAAMQTTEHVSLRQPSLAGAEQPLASDANPAPVGTINNVRQSYHLLTNTSYSAVVSAF